MRSPNMSLWPVFVKTVRGAREVTANRQMFIGHPLTVGSTRRAKPALVIGPIGIKNVWDLLDLLSHLSGGAIK